MALPISSCLQRSEHGKMSVMVSLDSHKSSEVLQKNHSMVYILKKSGEVQ